MQSPDVPLMTPLASISILAALQAELIRIVILAVVMLGGAILKKITDAREQAERERARLAKQALANKPAAVPPPRCRTRLAECRLERRSRAKGCAAPRESAPQ